MIKIKHVIFTSALLFVINCADNKKSEVVHMSKEVSNEGNGEWIYLFDGTNADGWRGFNEKSLPDGWIVENKTLRSLGKGGDIGGDIVYGQKVFDNFELSLEWKISTGGNSGIFYHVQEGSQYAALYETGPEYQLIDDLGYKGDLEDWQKVGADYAMYDTDKTQLIVKEAGDWNSSRIIFTEEKVEYWLNGKKVVSFVPWSDDWNERRTSDKWKDYPDYGKFKKGFIGLQDHGKFIWFRDIKIKQL